MPRASGLSHRSWWIAALLLLAGPVGLALSQETKQTAGPPYRVGGGVSRPEIVSNTAPVYTELARRAKITGTVILEATIDEQGNVTDTRILKGLPMGLDQSAVEAIKTWKFKPALLDGRPVPVYYVLTVNFQINDADPSYGPRFRKFLTEHPDFAARLHTQRFAEAAELLDRWGAEQPADADVSLARTHLLLEQGRLKDAWAETQNRRDPDPYEALQSVGYYAFKQTVSDNSLDAASRLEIIDLGLEAETLALAAKPDGLEVIIFKNRLLYQKAALTTDPQERQALLDEAYQLEQRVRELRAKQGGGSEDSHKPQ
jgi:TonB family protein